MSGLDQLKAALAKKQGVAPAKPKATIPDPIVFGERGHAYR
jgi:hypothetical protein